MNLKSETHEDVSLDDSISAGDPINIKVELNRISIEDRLVIDTNYDDNETQSMGSCTKRKRTGNFSTDEETLLIQLVTPVSNIMENKKGDWISVKAKQAAWQSITDKFNSKGYDRTLEQLRSFYDNKKRRVRKKFTDMEENISVPLTANEKAIWQLLRKKSTTKRNFVFDNPELIAEPKSSKRLVFPSPDLDKSDLRGDQFCVLNQPGFSLEDSDLLSSQTESNPDDGVDVTSHDDFLPSSSSVDDGRGKTIEQKILEQKLLNLQNEDRRQEAMHRLRMKHMKLEQLRKDQLHQIQISYMTKR